MSYILDALKKVEHEKTRRAGSAGVRSISGDLFRERAARVSSRGAWKIAAGILLVSLITFMATWFMLKGTKKQPVSASIAVAPEQTVKPGPPAAPAPESPLPTLTVTSSPMNVPPPAAASAVNEPAAGAEKKLPKTSAVPTKSRKADVQTVPAPADIKVAGIAWQEERAARRAVVNGFLLKEGTSVSGARILEIYQDRVRFSSPSGIFDIRLDAAAMSGPPK